MIAGFSLSTLLALSLAPPVQAAPGDLDLSFSGDGKVTTNLGSGTENAESIAIQTDGKILTAGRFDGDFVVVRYHADGSLDNNFGDPIHQPVGAVTADFGDFNDQAYALVLQNDGKIVVAGDTGFNGDFAVARFSPGGFLDTTFGSGNGKAAYSFSATSPENGRDVAIQPSGQIVMAGRTNLFGDEDFGLARFNSDGSVDSTFCCGDGSTGVLVLTDFSFALGGPGGSDDRAEAIAIQPDGKIVVAGESDVTGSRDFALARYNSDGSLDTTFGSGGVVTTDFGFIESADDLALLPSGQILAAGTSSGAFALARYNSNGSLDTTFGFSGTVRTSFGGSFGGGDALVIQADGKIVMAGSSDVAGSNDFAVARYNPNGTLDSVFNGDGKLTTDFNGSLDRANDLAIQPRDGRIVVAGITNSSAGIALARYHAFACDGFNATIVGTTGNDTLNGTAGADVIRGLDGNDTINGLGGNDVICGDAGNDLLDGGTGNDRLNGGTGIDTVRFSSSGAGVTANLATGTASGNGSDTLIGIENLTGSGFADTLTGNSVSNTLSGAGGNDGLNGAGGNDSLLGGGGNDAMNGGPGVDTCNGGPGTDTATQCETVSNVP